MKNFFKLGFFVLAITISIAGCSSSKTATSSQPDSLDSDTPSLQTPDTAKTVTDSAALKTRRDSLPKGFNKTDSVR